MSVTVEKLAESPIEQILCSESHADPKINSKRLTMYADVRGVDGIWFDILVNGKLYGQHKTIEAAVEEYNAVEKWVSDH